MNAIVTTARPAARRDAWPAVAAGAAAAALALAGPAGPLVALGAAAVAASALSPWWGVLAAVTVSLAVHADFIAAFKLPLLSFSLYPPDVVAVALLFGLAMSRLAGVPVGRPARLCAPLVALLAYMFLAGGAALARGIEPREVLADLRPFAHYGVALLMPALLVSRARLRMLAWVLLAASAAGTAYGIAHSLGNGSMVAYDIRLGFARLVGGSEGAYAPMACFGLVVLVMSPSPGLRALAAAQTLLAGAATLLTYSRGSWLSLLAGLAVALAGLLALAPRRFLPAVAAVAVASALVVAGLSGHGVAVYRGVTARSLAAAPGRVDPAVVARLLEYQSVMATFRRHPVFGAGPGALFHFFKPGTGWVDSAYTHNSFLWILAKWGLVGLALYLFFLGGLLARAARALRRAGGGERAMLLLGLGAALVALVVKSLSTWFLNTYTVTLWLGVVLGTLDALSRPAPELPEDFR